MKLTKDLLIRFAKTHVAESLQKKPRPLCIYLTGSVCTEDFLLGGCTDIDLVCIHNLQPAVERELIPLTPDVHLDIRHYDITRFDQPRQLRSDVWIGSFLCENPLVLHDNGHWFEFTQASVCSQFFRPEYALQRAQPLIDSARQRWMECFSGTHKPGVFTLRAYLRSIEDAANALACLVGLPLAERRMFAQFAMRAQGAGLPNLAGSLAELVTSPAVTDEAWLTWQPEWKTCLSQVSSQENCPVELSSIRHPYLFNASCSTWEKSPTGAIWLMLKTWTDAVTFLPKDSPLLDTFNGMCSQLELSPEHYNQRITGLDRFLEEIEAYFVSFKRKNSLSDE